MLQPRMIRLRCIDLQKETKLPTNTHWCEAGAAFLLGPHCCYLPP